MRPVVFMIATVLIASTLTAATWKEYRQPELGFLVEFPGDPAASTGRYHREFKRGRFRSWAENSVTLGRVMSTCARSHAGARWI